MGTELLLTGVFILLVLGLLVALVYCMVLLIDGVKSRDTVARQQRLLTSSILHLIGRR